MIQWWWWCCLGLINDYGVNNISISEWSAITSEQRHMKNRWRLERSVCKTGMSLHFPALEPSLPIHIPGTAPRKSNQTVKRFWVENHANSQPQLESTEHSYWLALAFVAWNFQVTHASATQYRDSRSKEWQPRLAACQRKRLRFLWFSFAQRTQRKRLRLNGNRALHRKYWGPGTQDKASQWSR